MKRIILTLALCLLASPVFAQRTSVPVSNTTPVQLFDSSGNAIDTLTADVTLEGETTGGTAATLTDVLLRAGCVRDDATTTLDSAHADGDYTPFRCNARGAAWVALDTALDYTIDSVAVRGANATAPIHCTTPKLLNMTTATTTEIVALSGSTHVYICAMSFVSEGDAASTVKLVSGTGSNCATSQADITAGFILTAGATVGTNFSAAGGGIVAKTNDAGDAVCVTQSGAANLGVQISVAQF